MKKGTLLNTLRRVTTQRFIPEIDGLRFLAIMPVVLMHLSTAFLRYSPFYDEGWINKNDPFRGVLLTGGIGVSIFFVISGFILALPFAKHYMLDQKPVNLKRYFLKRLTRLEPPYLITLTIFFFVHIWILRQQSFSGLLPHYGASFVYLHNLIFGTWTPINGVAWSLEIEVQFYILVPLITRIFCIRDPRWRRGLLLLLIVSGPVVQELLPLRQYHLYRSIFGFYQFFMAGFLMADLYLSEKLTTDRRWDLWGLLVLPLIFIFEYSDGFARVVLPLSMVLFFMAVFRGVRLRNVFCNPWIATIGGMCYITYLIHYPLLHFIMKATAGWAIGDTFLWDILLRIVVVLPVVFIVCGIAFVILEKPFMYHDWPARFKNALTGATRRLKPYFVRLYR